MSPISYLTAYGISLKHGDLSYKELSSGNYIVAWKSSSDIDLYLCKWLPASYEELDGSCVIDRILSFDNENEAKVAKLKQMLE